ncbi:hypothetical protein Taro_049285 [Colocasia esculenta]|uniref:Uncharacterized protein n=1 Tax=Colocasia esculenta TaxID=4460 RepID=A0A843XAJ0_COLES|nr:hypothetical protein [Colocasia esculenta]
MDLLAFGVQGSWVFIAPYVHEVPWGAWARKSRSNPLIPKQPRVQKNSHF